MQIRLTKISPTHHTLTYETDAEQKTLELETKTYLFHDLLHFAVETEAGLKHSFYGALQRGGEYATLAEMSFKQGEKSEAATTEQIVGLMTGAVKNDLRREEVFAAAENLFGALGEEVPAYLTTDFVLNVKERMRQLEGKWRGTPFGQTMELEF